MATAFIDFFAWCGLAYDLRVPSLAMVLKRMEQSGGRTVNKLISHKFDRSQKSYHLKVIVDILAGIVTLTMPIWLLAVGRGFYLCCAIND